MVRLFYFFRNIPIFNFFSVAEGHLLSWIFLPYFYLVQRNRKNQLKGVNAGCCSAFSSFFAMQKSDQPQGNPAEGTIEVIIYIFDASDWSLSQHDDDDKASVISSASSQFSKVKSIVTAYTPHRSFSLPYSKCSHFGVFRVAGFWGETTSHEGEAEKLKARLKVPFLSLLGK